MQEESLMNNALQANDLKKVFIAIKDLMETNKDYLCELDGALGDGDIGLTVSKGFRAIVEDQEAFDQSDIGLLLKKSGFVLAETVPSTIGTILATALMQAGNALKGKEELGTEELLALFSAMQEGIQKRGKASVGDKTILDSIHPAVQAVKEDAEKGLKLKDAIEHAHLAAQKGANQTIEMQSKHGRAERYFEKSIGHQDPGATVGALFVQGFYDYLKGE
jgi:dihydroxyacetone kinase-like protein